MIKPINEFEVVVNSYEKELRRLRSVIFELREQRRKAFQNGFGYGVMVITIISMVIIALVIP